MDILDQITIESDTRIKAVIEAAQEVNRVVYGNDGLWQGTANFNKRGFSEAMTKLYLALEQLRKGEPPI